MSHYLVNSKELWHDGVDGDDDIDADNDDDDDACDKFCNRLQIISEGNRGVAPLFTQILEALDEDGDDNDDTDADHDDDNDACGDNENVTDDEVGVGGVCDGDGRNDFY